MPKSRSDSTSASTPALKSESESESKSKSESDSWFRSKVLNFNIDTYINPHLRKLPLDRLPRPISHFLGHRPPTTKVTQPANLIIYAYAFLGAFTALIVVESLNRYAPGLTRYNPPVVIASLGASCILQYNAIGAPLSQPRNLILGQTLSAIVGVCVTRLFRLSPRFVDLRWVAGALSCGLASVFMGLSGTIYPPAGATAVLAATNTEIIDMGWIFIAFVLMDSVIFLVIALLINNVQRQFPLWWWTPADLPVLSLGKEAKVRREEEGRPIEEAGTEPGYDAKDHGKGKVSEGADRGGNIITIGVDGPSIPSHLNLSSGELALLRSLQSRLVAAKEHG